jgi:hypothetical protein
VRWRVKNDYFHQNPYLHFLGVSKGSEGRPRPAKNVEDLCNAAVLAVVDKIVPYREALLASGDVASNPARIRMFSRQPESLGDYPVRLL